MFHVESLRYLHSNTNGKRTLVLDLLILLRNMHLQKIVLTKTKKEIVEFSLNSLKPNSLKL